VSVAGDPWLTDGNSNTTFFDPSQAFRLEMPFSFALFLCILRLLRFLEIFPVFCVPWRTFTASLREMTAYFLVFFIIVAAFSLLFMYNLGGEIADVSGKDRAAEVSSHWRIQRWMMVVMMMMMIMMMMMTKR
jgi:hypothetical protein